MFDINSGVICHLVSSITRFSPVSSSDDKYCSVFAIAVVDSLLKDSSSEVESSSELKYDIHFFLLFT